MQIIRQNCVEWWNWIIWTMNLSSLLLILLFCGLILAQDTIETQSHSCVHTCNNANEFGAMREKIHSLEIKVMNIENRLTGYGSLILQLEQKGKEQNSIQKCIFVMLHFFFLEKKWCEESYFNIFTLLVWNKLFFFSLERNIVILTL